MTSYAPPLSKRVTLALLVLMTIGVFAVGLSLPYLVGESPSAVTDEDSPVSTRPRPVPVAQTTTSTSSG